MRRLSRADLMSLEAYAQTRAAFRTRVIAHKAARRLALGPQLELLFEDRLTVQYQVQEMLRAERLFEPAAVQAELDAYNPLLPDPGELSATMMITISDPASRRTVLAGLGGIERRVYAGVGARPPVFARAGEELADDARAGTAAVHFLRFALAPGDVAALHAGAALRFGVADDRLRADVAAAAGLRAALLADLG